MSAVLLPADALREQVAAGREALRRSYLEKPEPRVLLQRHAQLIDRAVKALWADIEPAGAAALVATGGYGRGELYPYSDIDLLVLLPAEPGPGERERVERLIGLFWDIGLEIGHSVRTVASCLENAAADITIQTTLLEARFLTGSRSLFRGLQAGLEEQLDPVAFFKAKKLEQEQRHAKHQDSPYSLEPNLKEAPGGLRDLQTIQWVARAAGLGHTWNDLVTHGLLERHEARQLARTEAAFQDMRIRLHYLAGRREDRLVFDVQTALAVAQTLNCLSVRLKPNSTTDVVSGFSRTSDALPIDACGKCAACTRIVRGVHPDVLIIEPGDSGSIKIDPVRDAIDRAGYRPFEGRRRAEREQADHRANFEVLRFAVRQPQHVVEEAVFFVPHPLVFAQVHHRRADPEEVLGELQRHVGVIFVGHRQFDGDLEHILAE